LKRNAIHFNQLMVGIGLIPKGRDTPIHCHPTILKPIFSAPTGTESGSSDQFLKPLTGHATKSNRK
jgi:hypothetical protein